MIYLVGKRIKISFFFACLALSVSVPAFSAKKRGKEASSSFFTKNTKSSFYLASSSSYKPMLTTSKLIKHGVNPLPPLRLHSEWGFFFGGISSSELMEETSGSFLKVESRIHTELNPQLHFKAHLEVSLNSERAQSSYLYKDQSSPLSLREAILEYSPFHWLTLRGGSLNQNRLESSLLVSEWAFPGLMQEIHLLKLKETKETADSYQLDLFASQSIPTSHSTSAERQEKEKTPYFFTYGIAFSLPPSKPTKLKLKFFQYQFQDLPNKVAYQSGLHGNSVNQISSGESARFKNTFEGYSLQGQLGYEIHPQWTVRSTYENIINDKAANAFSQGELLSASIYWHSFARKYQWEGTYGVFYNEPDSSPAAYNNKYLGHNNRQGAFWKFSFHWQNYSLHTRYWNYETMYTSLNQGDKNLLMLELEVYRVSI